MEKLYFLLLMVSVIFSCKKSTEEKDERTWSEIEVYDKLSDNPVFLRMKQMPEIIDVFEEQDSLLTRSAKVNYVSSRDDNFLEQRTDTIFNANAIIPHRDSLIINISFSNGFSGGGIKLHIKRNRFNTDVFEFTDIITLDGFGKVVEPKLTTKVYNQKLILDKHAYEIGDSIYGKMNFTLMQITDFMERKDTFYHKGAGYFRTKIKKNYY